MLSFRSLALIVLGAPFLSACIENACKSAEHQDVSFCQATDMSMSQRADGANHSQVDGGAMFPSCILRSENLLQCEYFSDKPGFRVDSIAMKAGMSAWYDVMVILRGNGQAYADLMNIEGASLKNISHREYSIDPGQNRIMTADKDNILIYSKNELNLYDWTFRHKADSPFAKTVNCSRLVSGGGYYGSICPGGNVSISNSSSLDSTNLADDENWVAGVFLFGKFSNGSSQSDILAWEASLDKGARILNNSGRYAKPTWTVGFTPNAKFDIMSGKLAPIAAVCANNDAISDVVVANDMGIMIFQGVVNDKNTYSVVNVHDKYGQSIKNHLANQRSVQAIAVAVDSYCPSGAMEVGPRLVWATAEDVTVSGVKKTKVTVNLLPLPLLTQ